MVTQDPISRLFNGFEKMGAFSLNFAVFFVPLCPKGV